MLNMARDNNSKGNQGKSGVVSPLKEGLGFTMLSPVSCRPQISYEPLWSDSSASLCWLVRAFINLPLIDRGSTSVCISLLVTRTQSAATLWDLLFRGLRGLNTYVGSCQN